MKPTQQILMLMESDGQTTFLAPESTAIGVFVYVSAWPNRIRQEPYLSTFSEPFLLREPACRNSAWTSHNGSRLVLQLGRYLQAHELLQIEKKILHLLQDRDWSSEQELETNVNEIVVSQTFEYDAPCNPLNILESDAPEVRNLRPTMSDDEIGEIADEAAYRVFPYMHPWDAYRHLIAMRNCLRP